ncbi:30S ribosomal protein S17 [Patescibacteria group bacterium]|nr:30S ribosomal protein S17 [Patescibacteria group bacterium]
MTATKNGKQFVGLVTSDKMQGTIAVSVKFSHRHPKYKKVIGKVTKIYADNNLKATAGDTVRVQETRPISKTKRFTTLEIVKKAA